MAKLTQTLCSASLVAGAFLAVGLAGEARAQTQDRCIYADQDYSHGAIFAGTRCNNGSWINLSLAEFRRLYPNGLGGPGVAPAGDTSSADPDGAAPEPAPPTPPTPP